MRKLLSFVAIVGLSTPLLAGAAIDTGSAYELLRSQFYRAQAPSGGALREGDIWFCSGSLEAAKGQMRYVPFWEPKYAFERLSENDWSNQLDGKYSTFKNQPTHLEGFWLNVADQSQFEFIRMDRSGNLLVEQASEAELSKEFFIQRNSDSSTKSALSRSDLVAISYYVCENPVRHEDEKWGNDRENLFGDKKRAAKSGPNNN